MTDEDLQNLLRVGRTRNSENDVTGMLIYAYESFMQHLEGPPSAVDPIFTSIENDDRHTELRLLSRREIEDRRFPDWSMGFEHPDGDQLRRDLPGYRHPERYPLVSSRLITSSAVAESLLLLSGGLAPR